MHASDMALSREKTRLIGPTGSAGPKLRMSAGTSHAVCGGRCTHPRSITSARTASKGMVRVESSRSVTQHLTMNCNQRQGYQITRRWARSARLMPEFVGTVLILVAVGRRGRPSEQPSFQALQGFGSGNRVRVISAKDLASAGKTFAKQPNGKLKIAFWPDYRSKIVHGPQCVRVLLA
jgi:hypothetical protein